MFTIKDIRGERHGFTVLTRTELLQLTLKFNVANKFCFKCANPGLFFHSNLIITLDFSVIRTLIRNVKGKHSDHFTTTTAQINFWSLSAKLNAFSLLAHLMNMLLSWLI